MNVQIFVHHCVFQKKEKQNSPNLSHFENESTFQKRTTFDKNRVQNTHLKVMSLLHKKTYPAGVATPTKLKKAPNGPGGSGGGWGGGSTDA